MATHSSILAGKIPRTEEPGGLQSMGSQRVGHDQISWAQTHNSSYLSFPHVSVLNPILSLGDSQISCLPPFVMSFFCFS